MGHGGRHQRRVVLKLKLGLIFGLSAFGGAAAEAQAWNVAWIPWLIAAVIAADAVILRDT